MTSPLTGGCLCGAIRYSVRVPVTALRACHCTDCQKTSGTGASVNAVLARADFTLTQGEPRCFRAKAASGRTLLRFFCGECGSPIYSQRETTPERITVRAGTFDDSSAMRITGHIWTRTARPWSWIDPATEQMAGNPP
jgi:hypothetical protein